MNFVKKNWSGILLCLGIAVPSWILGKIFPVIGGAVIAIITGMIVTMVWNESWSNFSDRKAIPSHYYLYHYNLTYHCRDNAEDS